MAPVPKPPGARVRRNTGQSQWRTLSAGKVKTPACPRKWSPSTRAWWRTIWRSPMATAWLEADVPALTRLGNLLELLLDEPTAAIASEIRQIEDRFGLSPKSRRQLQWSIVDPAAAAAPEPEPTPAAPRERRLRAV